MNPDSKSPPLYENLDTTFVNLWALLRNLSQRGFVGRVHVEMPDYAADVFINGSATPLVHEIDRAAGTDTLEEGALHRLVLRTRETPGKVSVFEGSHEAVPPGSSAQIEPESSVLAASAEEEIESNDDRPADELVGDVIAPPRVPPVTNAPAVSSPAKTESVAVSPSSSAPLASGKEPVNPSDWDAIVKLAGELIGAVERAASTAGADFNALFSAARLALADDYVFLDPTSNGFSYANSTVTLRDEMPVAILVAGLCEALRRVVDRLATGDQARRLRERVALELLSVARKREQILTRSGFRSQLDRIAGTKVV